MSRAASRKARETREGRRIELFFEPSARELFPALVDRLMKSRPVVGERVVVPSGAKPDEAGVVRTSTVPVFGKPLFRNVIDADGRHV